MRALFAAHPTVGHTQALRAIAGELRARGHATDFAISRVPKVPSFLPVPEALRAGASLVEAMASEGLGLITTPVSLTTALAAARIARTRGYDELEWACRLFTADALAAARVLLAHLKRVPTDVVVADYAFFGAWLAAEAAGVRHVAVFHSGLPFAAAGHPPFGSGLGEGSTRAAWVEPQRRLDALVGRVDGWLGEARRGMGLPPAAPRVLARPYATGLNVLTTFEAMELPRPELASRAAGPLLWAGPCLGARVMSTADDFPWAALEGEKPVVYVSLGTVFNAQPALYRTLLEGVHRAGARAVVAAGASLEAVREVAKPDDVVQRFVPQVALLPKVGAFISHGGNNSTNEALRAGTPLVLVPFGGEQVSNAQRAQSLGVATWLRVDALHAEQVERAVRSALEPSRKQASRALAARLPEGDGAVRVVEALLNLK